MKYKFKNFLDTVVYRGGDVFAQLIFVKTVVTFSKDLRVLAVIGALLCVVWLWNAVIVGRLAMQTFEKYKHLS
jgi:AAA family ATP:ADP antiporter